jgi:pseudouridine synthase
MRLQRWLALCGVASRRACEAMILEGRVSVNGRIVTKLGTKIDPERDEVAVDGERVKAPARRWYVALHKPKGVVCTGDDPAGRPRAVDLVAAIPARLFPIGRMEEESEGLLLLTNDGDFAQRVAHPKFETPKVHLVVVKGEPNSAALAKLKEGIWLAEGKTAPATIRVLRKTREFTTLTLMLRSGKYHVLRRILARVEIPFTRIVRVAIGPVRLGSLKRGEFRLLAPWEIAALSGDPAAAAPRDRPHPSRARHSSRTRPHAARSRRR